MRKEKFRAWLLEKGTTKKICSDVISRIKRIEKEINHCDLDDQYRSDHCESLMSMFLKMGKNAKMEKYSKANLPFGKYYMSTYRHAIKQYQEFCEEEAKLKKKK